MRISGRLGAAMLVTTTLVGCARSTSPPTRALAVVPLASWDALDMTFTFPTYDDRLATGAWATARDTRYEPGGALRVAIVNRSPWDIVEMTGRLGGRIYTLRSGLALGPNVEQLAIRTGEAGELATFDADAVPHDAQFEILSIKGYPPPQR